MSDTFKLGKPQPAFPITHDTPLLSVGEFRRLLVNAGSILTYAAFCKYLGWQEDDYTRDKFAQFQSLVTAISRFDPTTLKALVEAGR